MSTENADPKEFNGVEKPWRDKSLVKRLYIDKGLSVMDVSDRFGCSPATVSRWLDRHNIDAREQKTYPKLRDESYLRSQYIDLQRSVYEIASEIGCSDVTVSNWLEKHGIEARDRGDLLDERLKCEDKMRELYHGKELKISEIAVMLDCCNCTVRKFLSKHDIESRNGRFETGPDHFRWGGGHERYYGPNWTEMKRRAKSREDYQCLICSMTNEEHHEQYNEELHVHHIKKFKRFGSYKEANKIENLATVCKSCHYDVEKYTPLFPVII